MYFSLIFETLLTFWKNHIAEFHCTISVHAQEETALRTDDDAAWWEGEERRGRRTPPTEEPRHLLTKSRLRVGGAQGNQIQKAQKRFAKLAKQDPGRARQNS